MTISGIVKRYNRRIYYGFFQCDDGDNVFFHHSELESDQPVEEVEGVKFEIIDGPKSPIAIALSKV